MTSQPLDPKGHLKVSVSNFQGSKKFYEKIFKQLGWKEISSKEASAAWVSPDGFGFWIEQSERKEPKYVFLSPGLHHFCFKAASKEKVDEFHKLLVSEEVKICNPPKHYPQYTDKYYAVFFFDPDGIKLEVAFY